jgi:hypothetical protein
MRKYVAAAKSAGWQELTAWRPRLYLLLAKNASQESAVAADRRRVEVRLAESHTLLSGRGAEVHETRFIEGQAGMMVFQHKQRETIELFHREIETLQDRASLLRANTFKVSEEIRARPEECNALDQVLSQAYWNMKQQHSRIEAVQKERDLACRKVQDANKENAAVAEEDGYLVLSIARTKDRSYKNSATQ